MTPATFSRSIAQLFMLLHTFAQTYFDDIFVHSRAEGDQTAMEVHLRHLRRVFEVMVGVSTDPGKVKAIAAWPTLRSQKDSRKAAYAKLARTFSDPIKKDADGVWKQHHQDARLLLTGTTHITVDPGDPPRVAVPNDEVLKDDMLLETHGAPLGKWETHYAKTCETCQRVKLSNNASAPLQSLPVPADYWKSMSLDFVFGLPADDKGNTGVLVFVCRLNKMIYLYSDHSLGQRPVFHGGVLGHPFQLLGTKLAMSTADHPKMERVNRVLEDTLRSIGAEAPRSWSDQLPMVEFALNNAVHASTGFTPFYLNVLRHPQVPLTLRGCTDASIVSRGEARKSFSSQVSEIESESLKRQLASFIDDRLTLISRTKMNAETRKIKET
ncbi:Pol protein [Phytophthora palmivora]|uniref:Pol protein n=1 Tax=Phytophthora palmivora TaxID=4796 RepID=A0A2P4YDD4_9STRA|nr:Pol protein [Phytophthora palmivora]